MYCNKLDFALIRFKIELKNVVVHVELLITNFKLMAAVDLTNTLNRSNKQNSPSTCAPIPALPPIYHALNAAPIPGSTDRGPADS